MSYQEDKDIPERLIKMWVTDPSVEDKDAGRLHHAGTANGPI